MDLDRRVDNNSGDLVFVHPLSVFWRLCASASLR
jgi:hypothetical protein